MVLSARKRKKNGTSFRISRPDAVAPLLSHSLHFHWQNNGRLGVQVSAHTSHVPNHLSLDSKESQHTADSAPQDFALPIPEPNMDDAQVDPSDFSDHDEDLDTVRFCLLSHSGPH
jgi:hypothetical protein